MRLEQIVAVTCVCWGGGLACVTGEGERSNDGAHDRTGYQALNKTLPQQSILILLADTARGGCCAAILERISHFVQQTIEETISISSSRPCRTRLQMTMLLARLPKNEPTLDYKLETGYKIPVAERIPSTIVQKTNPW
jgi:hypothetical protein